MKERNSIGRPEEPDFASEAGAVVREAQRWRIILDFSPASLAALDLWISEAWDGAKGCIRMRFADDWAAQEWLIGCYIGEVLVRNFEGVWRPDPKDKSKSTVGFKGKPVVDPFAWARERAGSGRQVPIYGRLAGLRSQQVSARDAEWFVAQAEALRERYERNTLAVSLIDHALAIDENSTGLLMRKGRLLLPLHRFEEALACFNGANDPGADVLEGKGAALAGLGRFDEARAAYDEAMKLDASSALLHCRMGDLLRKQGRNGEAMAAFDRAVVLDAQCLPAHFRRGELLEARGECKEAIKAFLEVRRGSGAAALRWHHMGLCVDDRAHVHPEARDNAYRSGQVCSAYILICYHIGICEDRLHELGSAAGNLRSFLGSPPAGYEDEISEAKRLVPILETLKAAWDAGNQAGDIPLFVETMKKAVAMDPSRLDERRQLAIGLSMIDRHEEALQVLDTVLAEKPDFHTALGNKGTVLSKMGRLEEAVAVYDECLRREPDNRSAWVNKAVCLQQLKDDKRLRAFYTDTIKSDETHETAWFYIGLYAKQGGRMDAAADCFKKFLQYAKPDTPKNMIEGAKVEVQRMETRGG